MVQESDKLKQNTIIKTQMARLEAEVEKLEKAASRKDASAAVLKFLQSMPRDPITGEGTPWAVKGGACCM
eukprot:CAMPEP_0167761614 /NCGR_PEP_ID=MMETSP0110_2-20121227/12273_1 /TAXON_ID=629695 /ORGANISM="Gymnochlora sp., Strain CCMP2014" /LENGTH=69 /DNA_ID=CAMNT_0007648323 /DNA_START=35 /DNA_END=244 /DNA_ORIENTATION=-